MSSLPFENEDLLPNQQITPTPTLQKLRITDPDELIVGILYDFYFTPGRGHSKRLPRGRRTRAKKGKYSRRQRTRHAFRNYKSHMWAKLLDKTPTHLIVQRIEFEYSPEFQSFVEEYVGEPEHISKHNFYYANLETLLDKMEDPYNTKLVEPYIQLFTLYAANRVLPNGAHTFANAFADYNEM
jgi:hypothetical protein